MEEKVTKNSKTVKTPEELIEIAKKSGMELNENEKEKLYSLLNGETQTESEAHT